MALNPPYYPAIMTLEIVGGLTDRRTQYLSGRYSLTFLQYAAAYGGIDVRAART